jgi:hypothetical protein
MVRTRIQEIRSPETRGTSRGFSYQAQVKEGPKMTDIVKGAAIKGMTRPSRRFNEGRVCAKSGCSTKLSQYNKAEYCHAHAPVRFPRVRGKIMDGQDA